MTANNYDPLELLTPEEVAKKFRMGKSTIYRAIHKEQLPGVKICGSVRIRRETLEKWLVDREQEIYGKASK